ncbi:MAG: site-2 protease family protein, partial [Nanoarchaeota archaeon]
MSFIAYDLIFLLVFTLATIFFLYRRRSNLKRQGLLYLYHTRFGIKVIERISKQYAWILRPLQYVIITSGYLLMVVMVWMAVKLTYIYTKSPLFVQAVKIPPIIPLVPYLPELFKVDYLPPLYFTYWIVVIAIIAISHEFAHGIFARLNNIRVKSTGFGFLGPFLAAFVEPDEKQMSKASKFAQLSILGAGTFANVIMTLLFGLILAVFFMNSFTPAGVQFNSYTTTPLVVSSILTIAGMTPEAFLANTAVNNSLHEIIASNGIYLVPGSGLKSALEKEALQIIVYEDAPAVRAGLRGPIISVDSQPTHSITELSAAIKTHQPGDTVILVIGEEKIKEIINITLAERDGKAYLGIGVVNPS